MKLTWRTFKWVAFVGLKDDRPYEIFTGIADEDIFPIPKSINKGQIIKIRDGDGQARYDFRYKDKYGYENTIGGLSHQFNKACKMAGICDLRLHDLRHEATTRFFEKGLNTIEVATITGHKTVAMLQRYTHLRPESLLQRIQSD